MPPVDAGPEAGTWGAPTQPAPSGEPNPYGQPAAFGQPMPYGQPTPGPYGGPPAAPKTDGLAVAALVSSIVGVVLLLFCIGLAGTIAGCVMGIISRNRIKGSNGQLTGEGMALAGIIVGAVGSFLYLGFIVLVVATHSVNSTP